MKKNINERELPIYLFHQGTNYNAYNFMGAHFSRVGKDKGVTFRVWAPNADKVSVVGDFNRWDENACVMTRISDGGVYELFVKGLKQFDNYKFAVSRNGKTVLKADPYAFHAETPSGTASKVYDVDGYEWKDGEFIANKSAPYDKPMNIYEVNLASWKRHENGDYYTYKELSKDLVS